MSDTDSDAEDQQILDRHKQRLAEAALKYSIEFENQSSNKKENQIEFNDSDDDEVLNINIRAAKFKNTPQSVHDEDKSEKSKPKYDNPFERPIVEAKNNLNPFERNFDSDRKQQMSYRGN